MLLNTQCFESSSGEVEMELRARSRFVPAAFHPLPYGSTMLEESINGCPEYIIYSEYNPLSALWHSLAFITAPSSDNDYTGLAAVNDDGDEETGRVD